MGKQWHIYVTEQVTKSVSQIKRVSISSEFKDWCLHNKTDNYIIGARDEKRNK